MIIPLVSRRSSDDPSNSNTVVIIIAVTLSATAGLTSFALLLFTYLRRHRAASQHFREAQLRDPTLTKEEYDRRCKLTRSRLMFEEEIVRANMIRKSQQSRASDRKDTALVRDVARPTRSRSKTWHGRTPSADIDLEEGRMLLRDRAQADWGSAEANVERTWQLLHGKKYPSSRGSAPPWGEYDDDAPPRPPTMRLKTPPLLVHPLFRGWNGEHPPKHVSLPAELASIRGGSMDVNTARECSMMEARDNSHL